MAPSSNNPDDSAPLELDKFNRPVTVGPCLSDGDNKRCGTAEKVGYSCVGRIGAKFPLNKPLFRQMERPKIDTFDLGRLRQKN